MLRFAEALPKRRRLLDGVIDVNKRAFSELRDGPSTLLADLPEEVRIVEVGPRDGLQNEAQQIPTDVKIKLIDMLSDAGLPAVEATSFVSPRAVPQLADAAEVVRRMRRRDGVRYPVLVPNVKGLDRALEAGATEVAVFAAATETFSRRNLGCGMGEAVDRYAEVVRRARDAGLDVRGYISCVLGCPYEGRVDAERVAGLACQLRDMGCYEVSLGDTIGVGTPAELGHMLKACGRHGLSTTHLALHLHDTFGQALANMMLALQMGVSVFDSSVAGLGGCPFAPGATGNVATEDCLYLLDGLGIRHGVDRARLAAASAYILGTLGRPSSSRAGRAAAAAAERMAHA